MPPKKAASAKAKKATTRKNSKKSPEAPQHSSPSQTPAAATSVAASAPIQSLTAKPPTTTSTTLESKEPRSSTMSSSQKKRKPSSVVAGEEIGVDVAVIPPSTKSQESAKQKYGQNFFYHRKHAFVSTPPGGAGAGNSSRSGAVTTSFYTSVPLLSEVSVPFFETLRKDSETVRGLFVEPQQAAVEVEVEGKQPKSGNSTIAPNLKIESDNDEKGSKITQQQHLKEEETTRQLAKQFQAHFSHHTEDLYHKVETLTNKQRNKTNEQPPGVPIITNESIRHQAVQGTVKFERKSSNAAFDPSTMAKIITWNVNGLRSLLEKPAPTTSELSNPLEELVRSERPDILCLQETKLSLKGVSVEERRSLGALKGYRFVDSVSSERQGYSGVRTYVRDSVFQEATVLEYYNRQKLARDEKEKQQTAELKEERSSSPSSSSPSSTTSAPSELWLRGACSLDAVINLFEQKQQPNGGENNNQQLEKKGEESFSSAAEAIPQLHDVLPHPLLSLEHPSAAQPEIVKQKKVTKQKTKGKGGEEDDEKEITSSASTGEQSKHSIPSETPTSSSLSSSTIHHDPQGRVVMLDLPWAVIINTYVPNSGVPMANKLERRIIQWDQQMEKALLLLQKASESTYYYNNRSTLPSTVFSAKKESLESSTSSSSSLSLLSPHIQYTLEKPIIWTGDFNVADKDFDRCFEVTTPYQVMTTQAGFTPEERTSYRRLLRRTHMVDAFRWLYPKARDCYTYWSPYNNGRAGNRGWRLDGFHINVGAVNRVVDCFPLDGLKRWTQSDHGPVCLWIMKQGSSQKIPFLRR